MHQATGFTKLTTYKYGAGYGIIKYDDKQIIGGDRRSLYVHIHLYMCAYLRKLNCWVHRLLWQVMHARPEYLQGGGPAPASEDVACEEQFPH